MPIIFYGASDDCVEFDGDLSEEFYLPCTNKWTGLLLSPDGAQLGLSAEYGEHEWALAVIPSTGLGFPSWPVRIGSRPDRGDDPAWYIDAPHGTVVVSDFGDDD